MATTSRSRRKVRFTATLFEGHKGVMALVVPFDPGVSFSAKAVEVAPRIHGWLVRGTLNQVPFEGWIGLRYGRFFLIVEPELKRAAKGRIGGHVDVALSLCSSRSAQHITNRQAESIRHRR